MTAPSIPYAHRLTCTESQARSCGYWTAEDERGNEYVVGAWANRDGAGTLDADLRERRWSRDGDRWTPMVCGDAPAPAAWTADGKPIDTAHGRRDVVARLQAWVAAYQTDRRNVWLWGACGRGKDALARAAMLDLTAAGVRCVTRNFPALVATMRDGYGISGERRVWRDERADLALVPVLHLADVGVSRSDDVRELLYLLLDERLEAGRPTLCTSNLDPNALKQADERIASRAASGLVLELRGPDYRAGRV